MSDQMNALSDVLCDRISAVVVQLRQEARSVGCSEYDVICATYEALAAGLAGCVAELPDDWVQPVLGETLDYLPATVAEIAIEVRQKATPQ